MVTYFILMGISNHPSLQAPIFFLILITYLLTLVGNTTILLISRLYPHLHTPMYFFLCNLSIVDITFPSTVLPKLLDICLTGNQSITYLGCITQTFLSVLCVVAEYFLLAVMAFDRYMAICHPLRYPYLMNLSICVKLALVSWCFGFLESFMFLGFIVGYSFCRSKTINHLYCEPRPLIKLSCTGTQQIEVIIQVTGTIFGFVPLAFILITYVFIISSVLRIRSSEGKRKSFSTCSSHLTVVTLFFGIILGMYMSPKSASSTGQDKVFAICYTSCIPMLNPVIYSLRNKEVKDALSKLRSKIVRQLDFVSKD
ncbi:olfactory receptor 2G3-like [Discoglossus pictus]